MPALAIGADTHADRVAIGSEAPALPELTVTAVRDIGAILAMEQEWRSLEARCQGALLFQCFDWCSVFLDHAMQHMDGEPYVYAAWRENRLVALLPLGMRRNRGARVLTGLTEPFQQYTELLVAPGEDSRAIFGQFLQAMKSSGADYLHLGQVRADSALHAAIDGIVPPSGETDAAPYVALSQWPDFESYHKTIKAKTRKNMRNARNRLERSAPVQHGVATSGTLLAQVIDRSFASREAWLERLGLTSRAFRDTGFGPFLQRFKEPDQTGVSVIAFSLTHGEHPVADQWGFIHQGRYYAFMAGWDDSYEEASPGKLHLGAILESCYEHGIDVADFMIPAARYKFTWATNAVSVGDHVTALTMRGRLHNRLWLNFARPLAKRLAYAMPSELRVRLFRLIIPVKD